MSRPNNNDWVEFDEKNQGYTTQDGTFVASEIVENASCLADVLRISQIRNEQRSAFKLERGTA